MTSEPKVVLLSLNELTPSLMERFMREGRLPHFSRLFRESHVYTTDAEATGELLNPWVQWVTVHTGLAAEEHGIKRLNEGGKLGSPSLWDILSEHGHRVWICGSMNVRYAPTLNGYVLPDPWAADTQPHPADAGLDAYYRFVRTHVQEYTNEKVPLSMRDYVNFGMFMARHGLSPGTVTAIVRQLIKERSQGGRWRRAMLLDRLQFDVFRSIYKRIEPQFSTFFLNSVAHMQHAYWRHMDAEPFVVKLDETERREYGTAIQEAYMAMDTIIGRFLDLAGDDAILILATGLSQQPCLIYEGEGGKRFYRPRNFERLAAFIGLPSYRVAPVMSEQFHLYFGSRADADEAERKLRALSVQGRPAMRLERSEECSLFTGIDRRDDIPADATMTSEDGRRIGFYELFYRADTLKSGMHHPDGMFWIRTPGRQHSLTLERVPLRAVAPTILDMFGIAPPKHMTAEPVSYGRSERTSRKTRTVAKA